MATEPEVQAHPSAADAAHDRRGNFPGGAVGLVAAGLVAAGVFLPWMTVGGDAVSGWAASDDAKVLLGLAGIATVAAALLIGGARSLMLRLGLMALGLGAIGLGLFDMVSVSGLEDADVSLGLGLFLVISGGTLFLAAGALTRHRPLRH